MTDQSPLRIAVVYIAEAYQCYHGAAAALRLAAEPGVEVRSFYFDPDTPRHVERIHRAFAAPPMTMQPLQRSPITRLLQNAKVLGSFKHLTLRDNRRVLDGFDAILSVENTVAMARDEGIRRPKLIFTPHGSPARAYAFVPRIAAFDFVMLPGPAAEARMLELGLIRAGEYALTGSIKLETANKLALSETPVFASDKPIVLYNPHFESNLNSWDRFLEPMLSVFAAQDRFNLIVAPHVKMFRNASNRRRRALEGRSTSSTLIDTGSDRSFDSSYVSAASIYVGDVSSQVYEFLAAPRPCVFLNAHGVDWRADPYFAFWQLGDVVDDPADLMPAIAAAGERHGLYKARQEELAAGMLGERRGSASARAAAAVLRFLRRGRSPATSAIASAARTDDGSSLTSKV
jgi:hypothetical protein